MNYFSGNTSIYVFITEIIWWTFEGIIIDDPYWRSRKTLPKKSLLANLFFVLKRYKEGRVILERAMVTEIDGIEELEPDDIPKKTD